MTDQGSRPAEIRRRVLTQSGSCPVREQPQRLTLSSRCDLPGIVRIRSGQRRHRQQVLSSHAQGLPTGGDHVQARG